MSKKAKKEFKLYTYINGCCLVVKDGVELLSDGASNYVYIYRPMTGKYAGKIPKEEYFWIFSTSFYLDVEKVECPRLGEEK